MKKIFMITEHNIDGIDASGNRAQWEINALKKNEFPDVTLIDKFDLWEYWVQQNYFRKN